MIRESRSRSVTRCRAEGRHSLRSRGALLLFVLVWQALSVPAVFADGYRDPVAEKLEWQRRYQALRVQEARLIKTIELATKEYADANRRNYRRSGVRHFHRTNANEAKKQLALHRERMERFRDELRAAGGSLHWLDEVDEEPIPVAAVEGLGVYADDGRFGGEGAYPSPPLEGAGTVDPDDGRNPRFRKEDDTERARSNELESQYDYEAWRKDRESYEKDRAPERHLRRDDF